MTKAKNPVEKAAAKEPYLPEADEAMAFEDPSQVVHAGLRDAGTPVQVTTQEDLDALDYQPVEANVPVEDDTDEEPEAEAKPAKKAPAKRAAKKS